ncbi:NADH-quinone oxidoreductase subunit M [Alphaproteobacteria bacterium]|nr:NADH-quinone oxidoreductase subunit M [Alphaproteobacteria bacterium]
MAPAGQNFNFIELSKITIPRETQSLIFGLMILGFAIKAPVPPFNTWIPSVLMEGPIGISILLIGLKIGTYGMLRFVLPLLPDASIEWQTVMTWLGVFAILYGGFIALWQVNLRRLLTFASVSHVGLVLLGLFSLQEQGMQGSILAMINIGLSSTALVFLAGTLYRRTQSTELTALGGLARPMPRLAFFFFVIGLATIGMPGTNGFFGEFAIMWGAFEQHWQLAAVAVIGVALSAGYFLWYYERAFFGPAKPSPRATLRDLTGRETFAMSGVFALVIAIGLYPMPLLTMTASSVNALAERLDASRMAAQMQESPAAIVAKLGTGRETLCTTCNPGR